MDMEVEAYLRPPDSPMQPYPAKVITLATGAKLVVRQVDRGAIITVQEVREQVHGFFSSKRPAPPAAARMV